MRRRPNPRHRRTRGLGGKHSVAPLELRDTRNGPNHDRSLSGSRVDRHGCLRCRGHPARPRPHHRSILFRRSTDLQGRHRPGSLRSDRTHSESVGSGALGANDCGSDHIELDAESDVPRRDSRVDRPGSEARLSPFQRQSGKRSSVRHRHVPCHPAPCSEGVRLGRCQRRLRPRFGPAGRSEIRRCGYRRLRTATARQPTPLVLPTPTARCPAHSDGRADRVGCRSGGVSQDGDCSTAWP